VFQAVSESLSTSWVFQAVSESLSQQTDSGKLEEPLHVPHQDKRQKTATFVHILFADARFDLSSQGARWRGNAVAHR